MRLPSDAVGHAPVRRPLKDERVASWEPARLSDRKLADLQARLDRVRSLGGAFAHVDLSPYLKARLNATAAGPEVGDRPIGEAGA